VSTVSYFSRVCRGGALAKIKYGVKISALVAAILVIFLGINWPHLVQFKCMLMSRLGIALLSPPSLLSMPVAKTPTSRDITRAVVMSQMSDNAMKSPNDDIRSPAAKIPPRQSHRQWTESAYSLRYQQKTTNRVPNQITESKFRTFSAP